MVDIVGFIKQSIRVMNVASRPRQKEFEKIVTITAAGTIIIGIIGVILAFIFKLI